MAFICYDCAHPESKDDFAWRFQSKGPCENCGYVDLCVDSKDIRIDPAWKANLQRALDRMRDDGGV